MSTGLVAVLSVLLAVVLLERLAARRKAAERTTQLPRLALEDAAVAVLWIDPAGRLLYANRRACESLGYDRDELLSKTIHDLDPTLGAERWQARWQSLTDQGSLRFEANHRRRDGTILPVEIGANLVDPGGQRYACAFLRDLTALKSAQAALRRAKDIAASARSANDAKSMFLANVSHELRTPLTSIIGFSEVLLQERYGALGSREYRQFAESIRESGGDLLGLINDILDISKIEAGRMELCEEDAELAHVVQACLRLIGQRAQDAGLTVVDEVPSDLPRVCVDVRLLKQILLNLLSNAIKFTPEGGSVTLAAGREADGGLWLSVQDSGIGIARQHHELVFEPFEQVDNVRSRRYPGTGLGLPIAKKIVELHGGRVALESELAEGTKITLRLPAARVLGPRAPAQTEAANIRRLS
ncbi:MAG: ATP-binding protein [Kiloniellales bacterium]|nr:ATP-binding protein [Kiloniellales bacterium]